MKLALALEAIKTIAPLIVKSKKKKGEKREAVYVGGKIHHELETDDYELVYSKKKVGSLASLIVAILMAIAVNQGWLTQEQADILEPVAEEKVEQVIKKIDEATDAN